MIGDAILSSADAGDQAAPTVFLSYASEDRQAARRIGDALPRYGLEVWYDESELGGGDAWDQKIRKQIRECDYFMALVSARTEARREGYFRREWRLAVERTLDMADGHTFLLPIAIDDTDQAAASVPEKFLTVQWLKVPDGEPTPAFEALCRRLVSGEIAASPAAKKARSQWTKPGSTTRPLSYPAFPVEERGQRIGFIFAVVGWTLRSAWIFFLHWPRWLRISASAWIAIALVSKCTSTDHESAKLSKTDAQKLKTISDQYHGSSNDIDIEKLGAQIAREFSGDSTAKVTSQSPLLAIPFTAVGSDAAAGKLADATFAQVYGRVSISHPGQVGLTKDPLASREMGALRERGRASGARYILFGIVENVDQAQVLGVKFVKVADGATLWSKSYPAAGADPAKIAADVDSHVPSLDEDK